jgi:hypothetical protein
MCLKKGLKRRQTRESKGRGKPNQQEEEKAFKDRGGVQRDRQPVREDKDKGSEDSLPMTGCAHGPGGGIRARP